MPAEVCRFPDAVKAAMSSKPKPSDESTAPTASKLGAGDILELKPRTGRTTVMLPFTEAFVPIVDLAGRRIVVAATDGIEAATKSRDG